MEAKVFGIRVRGCEIREFEECRFSKRAGLGLKSSVTDEGRFYEVEHMYLVAYPTMIANSLVRILMLVFCKWKKLLRNTHDIKDNEISQYMLPSPPSQQSNRYHAECHRIRAHRKSQSDKCDSSIRDFLEVPTGSYPSSDSYPSSFCSSNSLL
ncbi:hypothetical protein CEXT_68901 [Caerostris extrusa]|uniref:Uncharacterized protein n=1 Tax=Caerostris extrusa TaxID=172846 RepID=A0AAV4TFJ8_CAEEX|nr:hypothetical protein CEXT_68901 [Caerostris extrusa]